MSTPRNTDDHHPSGSVIRRTHPYPGRFGEMNLDDQTASLSRPSLRTSQPASILLNEVPSIDPNMVIVFDTSKASSSPLSPNRSNFKTRYESISSAATAPPDKTRTLQLAEAETQSSVSDMVPVLYAFESSLSSQPRSKTSTTKKKGKASTAVAADNQTTKPSKEQNKALTAMAFSDKTRTLQLAEQHSSRSLDSSDHSSQKPGARQIPGISSSMTISSNTFATYDNDSPSEDPNVFSMEISRTHNEEDEPIVAELTEDIEERLQREMEERLEQELQEHIRKTKADIMEAVEVRIDDNDNNNDTTINRGLGIHRWMKVLVIVIVMAFLGVLAVVLALALSIQPKGTTLDTSNTTKPSIETTPTNEKSKFEEFVDRFGQNVTKDIRVFKNQYTAQYEAMNWLANLDNYVPNADSGEYSFLTNSRKLDQHYMERYAVALMYFSMPGSSSLAATFNFLSEFPVCEWNNGGACSDSPLNCTNSTLGVRCNDDFVVTELNFDTAGLQGSIPSEIGLLTALERIDFPNNQLIIGSIPNALYLLTNLISLSFDSCSLTGTISSSIGKLTNLDYLNVNSNALSGGIVPTEIGILKNLESLNLMNNLFTGSIPTEIGKLTNLLYLDLWYTGLEGPIPKEIGDLTRLTGIDLAYNSLTGTIPSEIGLLNQLELLALYNNNLGGTLPMEIGHLTQLTSVDLAYNRLTGTIPSEIGLLNQLEELALYRNRFSGTLPLELGQLSHLIYFEVDHNNLSGSVPKEFADFPLEDVRLHFNNFSGTLDDVFCNATATTTQMVLYADCGENQPQQCSCCLCCPAHSDC